MKFDVNKLTLKNDVQVFSSVLVIKPMIISYGILNTNRQHFAVCDIVLYTLKGGYP